MQIAQWQIDGIMYITYGKLFGGGGLRNYFNILVISLTNGSISKLNC